MDHKALSALILRISGLLVIVYAVVNAGKSLVLFYDVGAPREGSAWPIAMTTIFVLVLPVVLGCMLIYFPRAFTTRVLKIEGLESVKSSDVEALQRAAFSAIGLWMALFAIVDAAYFYAKTRLYFRFIDNTPSYASAPPFLPDEFGGLVSCALQLFIGVWLLFGNRALARLLGRMRD